MERNHHLAKSITDASWGSFVTMPINTIEVPKQINIDGVGTVSAGINFTGGLSLSANRERSEERRVGKECRL